MHRLVMLRVNRVALFGAGELLAETRYDMIDRAFCGFDQVGHQRAGVFGADGDSHGGGADACVGEGLFAHLAVAGDSGAEDHGVGLAKAHLVAEDGVEAVEEAGEGDAVDVGAC